MSSESHKGFKLPPMPSEKARRGYYTDNELVAKLEPNYKNVSVDAVRSALERISQEDLGIWQVMQRKKVVNLYPVSVLALLQAQFEKVPSKPKRLSPVAKVRLSAELGRKRDDAAQQIANDMCGLEKRLRAEGKIRSEETGQPLSVEDIQKLEEQLRLKGVLR